LYGNGTYTLSASNTSGSTSAFFAFDNVNTTAWLSGASYTTISTAFTTTVSGIARSGEWIQILLPESIILQSYSIQASSSVASTQSPASFILAGSNDASIWVLIDSQAQLSWNANNLIKSFNVANNIISYNYYRIIITSLISATGSLAASIADIKLYAYNSS
jgi:hypothetical protein